MYKEKNTISFYHTKNIEMVQGKSYHSFPKHSHKSFCIGIIKDGMARLNVDKQEYLLEKDDVYFIPPHIEHTIYSIDRTQYEYRTLCIYNDNIKKYDNSSLCNYVFKDKILELRILNAIENLKVTNDNHYFENMILNFLNEYIEIDYSCRKQTANKIVLSAVEFINDNLNETFDLQKLSEHTNITKYHLVRLFKSKIGITPYQFYIQEKIKQIRKGLLKQQPISDLVFDFNFSDESHLCNTFKKHMGITIMQFKDSCKDFN